jgi:hypothetical protein
MFEYITEIKEHLAIPMKRVLVVYDNPKTARYTFKQLSYSMSSDLSVEVCHSNQMIRLPNGSELYLSHISSDEDSLKFAGQVYSKIFLEGVFSIYSESLVLTREMPWRFETNE